MALINLNLTDTASLTLDGKPIKLTKSDEKILLFGLLQTRTGTTQIALAQFGVIPEFSKLEISKLVRLVYDRSLAWKKSGLDQVLTLESRHKNKVLCFQSGIEFSPQLNFVAIQNYLNVDFDATIETATELECPFEYEILEVSILIEHGKLKAAEARLRSLLEKLRNSNDLSGKNRKLFLALYENAWLLESINVEESRPIISELQTTLSKMKGENLSELEQKNDNSIWDFVSPTDDRIFNAMIHIRAGRYYYLTEKKFLAIQNFLEAIDLLLQKNKDSISLPQILWEGIEVSEKERENNKIIAENDLHKKLIRIELHIISGFNQNGCISYQLFSQALFYLANSIAKEYLHEYKEKPESMETVERLPLQPENTELSLRLLNFALHASQINKAIRGKVTAFFLIGWLNYQLAQHYVAIEDKKSRYYSESKKYYNFAAKIHENMSMTDTTSNEELGYGVLAVFNQNYDQAIKHFTKGIEICYRNQNYRQKSKLELRLARVYSIKFKESNKENTEKFRKLMYLHLENAAKAANECGLRRRYRLLIDQLNELRRNPNSGF